MHTKLNSSGCSTLETETDTILLTRNIIPAWVALHPCIHMVQEGVSFFFLFQICLILRRLPGSAYSCAKYNYYQYISTARHICAYVACV